MVVEWAPICTDGSKNRHGQRHARSLGMRRYRQKQREEVDRRYERKCRAAVSKGGSGSNGEEALEATSKVPTMEKANETISNAPTIRKGREQGVKIVVFESLAKPDIEDKIGSPEVVAESLLFCKRYLQWLKPELVLSDSDFAMFTVQQQQLPESLLVAARHLVATRHLDAASFHRRGEHYDERNNAILSCITRRLQEHGSEVSADLINAITCLLHFELCEGNKHEAMVHLQGLKTLMDVPGLSGQQRFTETSMSLEMAALINELTPSQSTEIVSMLPSNTHGEASYSPYHLIILTEELKRMGEPSLHSRLARELPTMRDVSRFVEFSLDTRNDQHEVYTKPSLDAILAEPDRPGYDPADYALIVKAMQASSSIVYRYAVQKYPIHDTVNQDLVKSIVNAVLFTPNERWRSLGFYRLFMLLIGTSVAQKETWSFCEAHLVRAIMQMGVEAWSNAREFIIKFIENVNSVTAHLRRTSAAGLINGPPPWALRRGIF